MRFGLADRCQEPGELQDLLAAMSAVLVMIFFPPSVLIPTATDFPKIRAIALENHRSPSNPLGVKGAGEGAIIPIGGLMANAVANALASFGAMPNQLPLSPARVWQMSSAKQSTASSG
jgi:hypothetical protein